LQKLLLQEPLLQVIFDARTVCKFAYYKLCSETVIIRATVLVLLLQSVICKLPLLLLKATAARAVIRKLPLQEQELSSSRTVLFQDLAGLD